MGAADGLDGGDTGHNDFSAAAEAVYRMGNQRADANPQVAVQKLLIQLHGDAGRGFPDSPAVLIGIVVIGGIFPDDVPAQLLAEI